MVDSTGEYQLQSCRCLSVSDWILSHLQWPPNTCFFQTVGGIESTVQYGKWNWIKSTFWFKIFKCIPFVFFTNMILWLLRWHNSLQPLCIRWVSCRLPIWSLWCQIQSTTACSSFYEARGKSRGQTGFNQHPHISTCPPERGICSHSELPAWLCLAELNTYWSCPALSPFSFWI